MQDLARAFFPMAAIPARAPPTGPHPDAPLPQSALWSRAAQMLGARVEWHDPPPESALPGHALIRRNLPLLGEVGMLSRVRLDPRGLAPGAVPLRRRLGCRHLLVHAEDAVTGALLRGAGYRRVAAPRIVAELSLSGTPDALAAQLSGKWRNRLRHGQRAGLRITRQPLPADRAHWLFAREAVQARRRGYRPLPPAMICALSAARPGAVQLYTAHHCGRRIGAALILRHGRRATWQVGWRNAEGSARSAGNLLLWQAMLDLQGLGVTRLDLGFCDPVRAPGLTRFKAGTGARLRALGGSWLDTGLLPRLRGGRRSA